MSYNTWFQDSNGSGGSPTTEEKKVLMALAKPEYIDIRIVEDILHENNGQELRWLKALLESKIKIMGEHKRPLKTDRFMKRIEEQQNGKKEPYETSPQEEAGER